MVSDLEIELNCALWGKDFGLRKFKRNDAPRDSENSDKSDTRMGHGRVTFFEMTLLIVILYNI